MKEKFKVEVAILFQDRTWDTVWVDVEVIHISLAKEAAEAMVRSTCKDTVSHVAALFIKNEE